MSLRTLRLGPVVMGFLVLALAACNGGGGAATKPVIASFTATPAALPGGGGDVTLAWSVQDATSLSIEPGVGAVTGSSLLVRVAATTTYVLTATGPGGNTMASVTVTVVGATDNVPPTVVSVFPADGATGVRGEVELLIEFSEPMDQNATEDAYASASAGLGPTDVGFSWNAAGTILTVTPAAPLAYAQGTDPSATAALEYVFALGAGATDLAGNALAAVDYGFATLRHITTRLAGDPAQDGDVSGGVVFNGSIDFSVGANTMGFAGFVMDGLPAELDSANVIAARLLLNGEFPCSVLPNQIGVEHVVYGATIISGAVTTEALRSPGFMTPAPEADCWNAVDVQAAVADDWTNRAVRGGRSQYRLTCAACMQVFFASEVSETTGDAREKGPVLEVGYLVP